MHGADAFLAALAAVLCVAALTTVLFRKLRQPVVLGYILAGLIIGPHVPIPLVADPEIVRTLSELGVILLMFALGLELPLKKLVGVGPTAGVTAVVQCSIMMWLGFVVGRLFGWTTLESIFAGAIIAISSTTIIAKAFDEQGIGGRMRELVVGILVVEDLIAILLMAGLSAIASSTGVEARELAFTVGRLAAFLVGVLVVGMLLIPRAMRAIVRLGLPETTLVASMGICFAVALLAHELGYSVALGAFLAGSLVAESGEAKKIEPLVFPVRDVFAAVFFVSVGMMIDPRVVLEHGLAVAVFTLVVIFGKIGGVTLGAFLSGAGTRTSVQAGMSLAQIGEFSFIIAALGLTLGVVGEFLYPVAVAVSALTTLSTPWLIRASGPVANFVDRKLPKPLQTFAALYARWVEQLKSSSTRRTKVRRLVRLLVLDAALLTAVIIAAAVFGDEAEVLLERRFGFAAGWTKALVMGAALALGAPLFIGILRVARRLGIVLAARALPEGPAGRVDLAASPRRSLIVTLQLAIVLFVGLPLIAITQPFLEGVEAAVVLAIVVAGLAVIVWKRAADLHGHVRAGAQVIVAKLADQGVERERRLDNLPLGIGEPVTVELADTSPAIGKSLADLAVRGRTGAAVLAIVRGEEGFIPNAKEPLRAGDVLALGGSRDAIAAATSLLLGAPVSRPALP